MREWIARLVFCCMLVGTVAFAEDAVSVRVTEQAHDGWRVQMPAVVGIADETVASTINKTILEAAGLDNALMQLGQLRATGAKRDANTPGIDVLCDWQTAGDALSLSLHTHGKLPEGREGDQTLGFVFNLTTGEKLGLDVLFTDVDAAVETMETIALADQEAHGNAYSEFNQVKPLPRDNFSFNAGQLVVHYPDTQLAYFSGRAGGYAFYQYELADVLNLDSAMFPFLKLPAAKDAISAGKLPGIDWAIGDKLADVINTCGLREDPNYTLKNSVYTFEAPEMRGVSLLASPEAEGDNAATVLGIRAERMQLDTLTTGTSTLAECKAIYGEPTSTDVIDAEKAYDELLPEGETLWYETEGHLLGLHFVDDVLQQVILMAS